VDDRDDVVLGDGRMIVRRIAVVVVALVFVAVVGALLARRGGDAASPSVPGPAASVRGSLNTSPAARADVAAARAAAVRAVGLTDDVVRAGFISRRELVESFTTDDYGPTLADETSNAVNATLVELGQRDADVASLSLVEQPVTATAEPMAGGVRVRVWSVLVIAAPGAGPGREVWRTVTLDMVASERGWLVDRWTSTPGPSPAPPAEGSFDDAAALVEPLGWPAADTGRAMGAG
jgi:hypothetical protein